MVGKDKNYRFKVRKSLTLGREVITNSTQIVISLLFGHVVSIPILRVDGFNSEKELSGSEDDACTFPHWSTRPCLEGMTQDELKPFSASVPFKRVMPSRRPFCLFTCPGHVISLSSAAPPMADPPLIVPSFSGIKEL